MSLRAPGADEAVFVGEHDDLDAVAKVEFGQHSAEVCLLSVAGTLRPPLLHTVE